LIPCCHSEGEKWLGLLGTNVEIEEHLCPFTQCRSPRRPSQLSSQKCFRECHKRLCPSLLRRTRRRIMRSKRCSGLAHLEKSWFVRLLASRLSVYLTRLDDPARHMARRALPNWFSLCLTRSLTCFQTSVRTSEPSGLCRFGVTRRH